MTTNIIKYKDYTARIHFSAEDDEFYGEMLDMGRHVISFGGKTVAELKKHMKEAVDGYLEFCREKKISPAKPVSGRITYRTTPQNHLELIQLAGYTGKDSLNAFIDAAIAHYKSQLLENRT
jgi:predicted HicB family RNase H-like nuclease